MKKPSRAKKLGKTATKAIKKTAAKNPSWLNDVTSSTYWNKPKSLGRFGAASPVRHIVKDGVLVDGT